MEANDYVIQYPLDAIHPDKFAELLGKPTTAIEAMIKARKLPVVEFSDPSKPNARVGDRLIFLPAFNAGVREAFNKRPPEQRDAWLLWMGL
ncbi:hypothetical protein B1Q90_22855 [Salmonella enterica subsp. enterica serovar Arechavaleta]|nr:hypothetical protein [Salmonella enterica]EBW9332627.1 hypothetical protein [Salmonella enterica subsp. enterica serovar Arechavaleta]EDV8624689.1 hypothetical protein [Salmonella enterica subsp. enterica]EAP3436184.1 hypothetical protein [Salmonella enterica]EAT6680106.1 hypothetical protein [Salmonella enterica]